MLPLKCSMWPHWEGLHPVAKYDLEFNFHLKKDIDSLIEQPGFIPHVILYNDVMVLAMRKEYIRRDYCATNDYSPSEVRSKLTRLGKLWDQNQHKMFLFQHPTMFITGTHHLFIQRKLRIRQNRAVFDSEESANEFSAIESSDQDSSYTELLEGSLSQPSDQSIFWQGGNGNSERSSYISFQSTQFDIFQESAWEKGSIASSEKGPESFNQLIMDFFDEGLDPTLEQNFEILSFGEVQKKEESDVENGKLKMPAYLRKKIQSFRTAEQTAGLILEDERRVKMNLQNLERKFNFRNSVEGGQSRNSGKGKKIRQKAIELLEKLTGTPVKHYQIDLLQA